MPTIIEFCISGLGAISVSGLAMMHTWLIARMETTNEEVRAEKERSFCNLFFLLSLLFVVDERFL